VEERSTAYTPPKDNDAGADWHGSLKDGYAPTARQQAVVGAVEKALANGVFYGDDLRNHVAKQLGVADPSGQAFGMDVHHAERYVEAKRERESGEQDRGRLNAKVGDQLGTLMFADGTKVTGVTVGAVDKAGPGMQVAGKKAGKRFSVYTTAGAVMAAMDKAKGHGLRKDGAPAKGTTGKAEAPPMTQAQYKREEYKRRKDTLDRADETGANELGPVGLALRYFANGGKVDRADYNRETGEKGRGANRWMWAHTPTKAEKEAPGWRPPPTIEMLAHQIWENSEQQFDTQDI